MAIGHFGGNFFAPEAGRNENQFARPFGAVATLITLALAGCAHGARMEARFDAHDLNGDGRLDLEEFQQTRIAQRAESPDALFRDIDANGDQLLSFDEITQHFNRQ